MKKILAFLLMFVMYTSTEAQVQTKTYYKNSNNYQPGVGTYIDWQLTNQGCYGCASFYWMVNRSFIPSMNQYRFDMWFYSNSYYTNGVWASTYVQGLYFNVDGYFLYKDPSWLLFREKYSSTYTSFYTSNATPVIKISWSSMSVY
jgi:hypothetical protein